MKKLQKRFLGLSIILIIIITLSIILIPLFNTPNTIEVTGNHEPIYIDGNTAFINISSSEGWEGNGTYDNPYIIKDYIIKDSPTHGIEIRNTDAYFIINNVSIYGGDETLDFQDGINLYNVSNGILISNNVMGKDHGYFLENSHNNSLIENTAIDIDWDGFSLENSDRNNLTRNTVRDCWYGFTLENSDDNSLIENTAREISFDNFDIKGSNRNILRRNNIKGGDDGICIRLYSNYNNISSNIIKDVYRGIYLYSSDYNTVTGNSITQYSSECVYESICEGNIISDNECRSIWVDVGFGFIIVLIIIVVISIVAVMIYRARPILKKKTFHVKPILKIRNRIDQKKREQKLKAVKFETLLRDSKVLIDQGNKSFSKKKYEDAIEKWQESVNKYITASKDASSASEKARFKENIKMLRESMCKAYLERGKKHDSFARTAHTKADIQKANQEWNSAIKDFQIAIDLIKSEKLAISLPNIEKKINSIRLNLKQIEIERIVVETDKKVENAKSIQNKDLIQATKLTQEVFIQYSEAKKKAEKYPKFQELIYIILKKLENTRQFQLELQNKMDHLIGITPLKTNIFIEDTEEFKTIISTEEEERGLFISREYEFLGGQIRFKIAIRNRTRSPLTDFKISLHLPDALKWMMHEPDYERRGDSILISKLGINETKTVSLYLEPINCLSSPINATISFFDAKDRLQAVPMEPKMITITCPIFFTKEDANLARVKHLQHSLNHQDRKVFPIKDLEKAAFIFNSVLSVLGKYDIKLIFKEYSDKDKSGDAWFYGVTKVKSNKIIIYVELNGKRKILELEVSGNSEEQITAFLAEISNKIRQELIKNNVIISEDEFYDMNISVISHTCPYCGESIQQELVQEFLDGEPIECNYCNVKLNYHHKVN